MSGKDCFGRLGDGHANERDNVSQRISHQSGGKGIAKPKFIRGLDTLGPGESSNDVTKRRDGDNEEITGAQTADAVDYPGDAGFSNKIREQQQTKNCKKNTKRRELSGRGRFCFGSFSNQKKPRRCIATVVKKRDTLSQRQIR